MNSQPLTPAPPCEDSCATDSLERPFPNRARRILLADDDESICHVIFAALAHAGFDVNTVPDGEAAWEALLHAHYDLLVTDNQMPRLAGIKLIERIRKAGMSLPVIIASGTFSAEKVRDYPQLQIAAVLPKPFGSLELLDTVRRALQSPAEAADAGDWAFHQLHANLQLTR